MTGTFSRDFAFNCNAFDHPDLNPEWEDRISFPPEDAFCDGWIYKDGELVRIATAKKITNRDPSTGRPLKHQIEAVAENGQVYKITGETKAGLPWAGWPNMLCHLHLTRWQCDGLTGWGDTQECHWNDYAHFITNQPRNYSPPGAVGCRLKASIA